MAALDSPPNRRRAPIPASALSALVGLSGSRDGALAILNGLFGDTLDERGSRLATPMTISAGDTVLPLDRERLAQALAASASNVTPRICVLVHGLMSTESIWRFRDADTDTSTSYADVVADTHGVTPLTVRYNTGRHISTNGRELARLLDDLVRAWPLRVREINLIGHSMGGLVVRSACYYGRRFPPAGRRLPLGRRWTSRLRRVVLIGVPNTGAGLEAFVNSASAALWALPIPATRLVGLGLDRRSAGIKDLRFGAVVDEDWLEHDPATRHRPHPHRPHRLRRTKHLVVAGSVAGDEDHPVARLIGDALVTSASASGQSHDGDLFPRSTALMFPNVTHNTLARHHDVARAITEWW